MKGAAIYVLIDALGWEIVRHRRFLDDICTDRRPVRTILGYSSGAIPTLLTGTYPADHGHWNLFYRSPRTSPFRWTWPLGQLPRPLRESRVLRRAVAMVSRRVSGYTGYFTIYNVPIDRLRFYDICEHSDIYSPGGLAPASSVFDGFERLGIPYECYNYHRHSDAEILALLPERFQRSTSEVFFVYLADFDAFLHSYVTDADAVTERLAWYEHQLRRVYEAAVARYGAVRLYVFSDHGMTPVTAQYDLIRMLSDLDLRVPDDYLPSYDSTMARFWLTSPRAERRLRERLDGLGVGRVLSNVELKEHHIDFADRRYGDLVYLMNPGCLICPSDMGRKPYVGMHGFHPDDAHSSAVLLSTESVQDDVDDIAAIHGIVMRDAAQHARRAPA